jgi:hypothetical protein
MCVCVCVFHSFCVYIRLLVCVFGRLFAAPRRTLTKMAEIGFSDAYKFVTNLDNRKHDGNTHTHTHSAQESNTLIRLKAKQKVCVGVVAARVTVEFNGINVLFFPEN